MTEKPYRNRRTKHPQFVVTVTDEQLAAIDAALPPMTSRAAFVRQCLAQAIAGFPQNMNKPGETPTD